MVIKTDITSEASWHLDVAENTLGKKISAIRVRLIISNVAT